MYFLYIYNCGTLKPIEIVFRRENWKKENNGGDEPNPVYCVHI
jgi:hypothetical protein